MSTSISTIKNSPGDRFCTLVTGKRSNKPYEAALSNVTCATDFKGEEQRETILRNCNWILDSTNPTPMSGKLARLSGNTKDQIQYHNEDVKYLAKIVKLLLERKIKPVFVFDIDGSVSAKTRRTDSTRETQSLDQVFEFYKILDILRQLGVTVLTNTNRAPYTTNIAKRAKSKDPPVVEAPFYSPIIELSGLSPRQNLKFLKNVGIVALSTGFVDKPRQDTEIAFKLRLAYDLINELGDGFKEGFIQKPSHEYKCSGTEPKGLNELIILQDGVGEKDLQPSYKAYITISAIREDCIKHGTDEEYKNYREEILKNIRDRENITPILKELRGLYEKKKENLIDEVQLNLINQKIQELNETLNSIQCESKYSEKPTLTLGNSLNEIETSINSIDEARSFFIRIPGESAPDREFVDYIDSFGRGNENRKRSQKHYNLFCILQEKPDWFDREINKLALTSVCHHYDKPSNIREETLVTHQLSKLQEYQNETGGSGEKIRTLIKKAYSFALKTGKLREEEKLQIEAYVKEGKLELYGKEIDKFNAEGAKRFVRWKLCKFANMYLTEDEVKKSNIFEFANGTNGKGGAKLKKSFLETCENEGKSKNPTHTLAGYLAALKEGFEQAGGQYLSFANYIDDIFPDEISDSLDEADKSACLIENNKDFSYILNPDYLYCRNYKEELTGKETLLPAFVLEDKRDNRLDYCELLPCLHKGQVIGDAPAAFENGELYLNWGDSKNDVIAHVKSLLTMLKLDDGEIIGGAANQIYNLIENNDYLERAIKQSVDFVKSAKENKYSNFQKFCDKTGFFGLEKVNDEGFYKKVIGVKQDGSLLYADDEKLFSTDDLKKEYKKLFESRIFSNAAPDANIRRLYEAMTFITGSKDEFKWDELERAKALKEKGYENLTDSEKKLVDKYKVVLTELEVGRYEAYDTPLAREYFEYTDPKTNEKYYRMRTDKSLQTKDGKVFCGDESKLTRRGIVEGIANGRVGIFIYKDTLDKIPELFEDIDFLNKCYPEDSVLPAISHNKGIFTNNVLLWIFGLGNKEKGKENLKCAISKMPTLFTGLLEWSGGIMALGGLIRLLSKGFGSSDGLLFKGGYWISNISRSIAAIGGALRGIINPHKYYSITIGELINTFSAIFLPNGPKHFGYALGNLFLFTGRGSQSIQRQLDTNLKPANLDPKELHTEDTKFAMEDMMLGISNSCKKNGMNHFIADFVGSITSAIATPFKHLADILKDKSLLKWIKKWVSQKSGVPFGNFRSVGHILTLSGIVSGVGAVVGTTLGRIEKLGEISESGFNWIGKLAMAAATALPAFGIFANAQEVAVNSGGLPLTTRGLDGKTINYDPKRAGNSQKIASLFYLGLPWFDLAKDWVAAAFDTFGMGLFFGIPGTKTGVAAEDTMIALQQAENILFENDKYFTIRDNRKIIKPEAYTPNQQ